MSACGFALPFSVSPRYPCSRRATAISTRSVALAIGKLRPTVSCGRRTPPSRFATETSRARAATSCNAMSIAAREYGKEYCSPHAASRRRSAPSMSRASAPSNRGARRCSRITGTVSIVSPERSGNRNEASPNPQTPESVVKRTTTPSATRTVPREVVYARRYGTRIGQISMAVTIMAHAPGRRTRRAVGAPHTPCVFREPHSSNPRGTAASGSY